MINERALRSGPSSRSPRSISVAALLALSACNASVEKDRGKASASASTERDTGGSRPSPRGGNETDAPKGGGGASAPASGSSGSGAGLVLEEGAGAERDGYLVITGSVKNATADWYKAVKIELELFDAAGKPLSVGGIKNDQGARERVYASRDHVPPGESTPFKFTRDIEKITGKYASHKLHVTGVKTEPVGEADVIDFVDAREGAYHRVTGSLKTRGSKPCFDPKIVVAAYDGQSRVIDVEESPLKRSQEGPFLEELAPGASGAFKVLLRVDATRFGSFASCEAQD